MEETMNTFGLDVKKLLIDKHMSQKVLALLLIKSERNLSKILNSSNQTYETMLSIADALDCDLAISLIPKKQEQEKTLMTTNNSKL